MTNWDGVLLRRFQRFLQAGLPFPRSEYERRSRRYLRQWRVRMQCWSPPTTIFGISTGQHGFECTSRRYR